MGQREEDSAQPPVAHATGTRASRVWNAKPNVAHHSRRFHSPLGRTIGGQTDRWPRVLDYPFGGCDPTLFAGTART